jgi:hypothetical protein
LLTSEEKQMKRIVWWTIEVEWEDGTRETLSEIPDYVASEVDGYLGAVEDERNIDEGETNDSE